MIEYQRGGLTAEPPAEHWSGTAAARFLPHPEASLSRLRCLPGAQEARNSHGPVRAVIKSTVRGLGSSQEHVSHSIGFRSAKNGKHAKADIMLYFINLHFGEVAIFLLWLSQHLL